MRHGYFGRKLSRTVNERRRLFMILVRSLLLHGRIRTSFAKAKAVQPIVERLITKAKKGKLSDHAQVRKILADKISVASLLAQAKTRFAKRTSGYTRIVRLGLRLGDAGETVLLEFVDEAPAEGVAEAKPTAATPDGKKAQVITKAKPAGTQKKSPSKKSGKAQK